MPSDLTWNQLQSAINTPGVIQISGTNLIINVNLLTGDTYADMNAAGVTEFVQKLLDFCNKAQVNVNQGIAVGQRLAAFPPSSLGSPTRDIDGVLRITCNQQVLSRLTVDANQITANQN